jgi:hypothetical protein
MADQMPLSMLPPAAHLVLGLPATATPEEARAAYLAAVKRHPPDRDPERFRELHAAMLAFCDPLPLAEVAFEPLRQRSDLQAIIADAATRPPRLPTRVLLGLGNVPQDRDP